MCLSRLNTETPKTPADKLFEWGAGHTLDKYIRAETIRSLLDHHTKNGQQEWSNAGTFSADYASAYGSPKCRACQLFGFYLKLNIHGIFFFFLSGFVVSGGVEVRPSINPAIAGNSVTLSLFPSENIKSGSWSVGQSPVVTWQGTHQAVFPSHTGRAFVNISTGALTLTSLTVADSGFYEVVGTDPQLRANTSITVEGETRCHSTIALDFLFILVKPLFLCFPKHFTVKEWCELTCKLFLWHITLIEGLRIHRIPETKAIKSWLKKGVFVFAFPFTVTSSCCFQNTLCPPGHHRNWCYCCRLFRLITSNLTVSHSSASDSVSWSYQSTFTFMTPSNLDVALS